MSKPSWIDRIVGTFDDNPTYQRAMDNQRRYRNRLNRQLDEFTKAGELSDEQLVEAFVAEVLNGLDTGSREEALAEELVERFSALAGVEVTTDSKTT